MNEPNLELSIVMPGYNRPTQLVWTLENLTLAARHLGAPYEIVIVDDGSIPPLESDPRVMQFPHLRIITQENQGSSQARLRAVLESKGKFVFLSDSDDFVAQNKFTLQINEMIRQQADCSFCDEKKVFLKANGDVIREEILKPQAPVNDSIELMLNRDLRSNNLILRGDLIRNLLSSPLLKPKRAYGPAGDYFIYYNLAVRKFPVVQISQVLSSHCIHEEGQLSNNKAELDFSALRLMEDFVESFPEGDLRQQAFPLLAERVFKSWRKIPRGTPVTHERRLEVLLAKLPKDQCHLMGGPWFRLLAKVVGPIAGGRICRAFSKRRFPLEKGMTVTKYLELLSRYSKDEGAPR